MRWKAIIYKLFKKKKQYDDGINKIYAVLEQRKENNEKVEYCIIDIKKNGFLVKVKGLYAYLPLAHMPWYYPNKNAWFCVAPYIEGKVFYGKIYYVNRAMNSIIIDGKIPSVSPPSFVVGRLYLGVVLYKTDYGVFIDFGYHFDWQHGVALCMTHHTNFERGEFELLQHGALIKLHYWGLDMKERYIFSNKPACIFQSKDGFLRFDKRRLEVKVTKPLGGGTLYLIENIYPAKLPLLRELYASDEKRSRVKQALRMIETGEIIHCRAVRPGRNNKFMILEWDDTEEIEIFADRSSCSSLSDIGNGSSKARQMDDVSCLDDREFEVKVIKEVGSPVKYLVGGVEVAQLPISKDLYPGRKKLKELKLALDMIESGEIIHCKALKLNDKDKCVLLTWSNRPEIEFFAARATSSSLMSIKNLISAEQAEELSKGFSSQKE